MARYEDAIARGDTAGAILKGVRTGPRWLRLLPRPLAVRLIGRLVADGASGAADGGVTFGSLVPTMHHDVRISDEGGADLPRLRALDRPVLLVGGTRSRPDHDPELEYCFSGLVPSSADPEWTTSNRAGVDG